MKTLLCGVLVAVVGCGVGSPPANVAKPLPVVEMSPRLKETGITVGGWEMGQYGTLHGVLQSPKSDMRHQIMATYYNKQNVKVDGPAPRIPDNLLAGERGKISIEIPAPTDQIARVVLDLR